MKPTIKNKEIFIKKKLSTDKVWATKALVRIYTENQTQDEQAKDATIEDNGVGFVGIEAQFLSSLAKQYIQKGFLTDNQMAHVFKKIQKYWRQVMLMSDENKLNQMVEKA
jgi:hypothetical protein